MGSQSPRPQWRHLWSDTPALYKIGVVLGVAAWFVSNEGGTIWLGPGDEVLECHLVDLAKMTLGILVVACAVGGFAVNSRARFRISTGLSLILGGGLAAYGVLIGLYGAGVLLPLC